MRRFSFLLGTLALTLILSPAMAKAAGFEPGVGSWTGWYVGFHIGTNRNAYDGFGSANTLTQELTGGYNFQLNPKLVLGADLYSDWNTDTNHSVNALPGVSANYGSRGLGMEFMAGFPVGNFLPYVKAGYGQLSISGNLSGTANGARYGAGLIWRINTYSGLVLQYTYQKVNISNSLGNGDYSNSDITVGYNWFFD